MLAPADGEDDEENEQFFTPGESGGPVRGTYAGTGTQNGSHSMEAHGDEDGDNGRREPSIFDRLGSSKRQPAELLPRQVLFHFAPRPGRQFQEHARPVIRACMHETMSQVKDPVHDSWETMLVAFLACGAGGAEPACRDGGPARLWRRQ